MSLLFIDSTYDITLGILDDDLEWIDFQSFAEKKASSVLQKETSLLLKKNNINPQDLKGVITIAGPGFYTGLRLSEGFADVFTFFNIPHYSFYSYEIPVWCGHKEGSWFTKAYRGEYFFHHWRNEDVKSDLVSLADLPTKMLDVKDVYIHSIRALDEVSTHLLKEPTATLDLLKANPHKIFSQVLAKNLKRESFYFRAPEDEFRMNP